MTSVSVIIAAFNRPDSLGVLLRDLSRQELDGEVEVIVVDDGSEPSIGPEVGVAFPSGLSGTILRQANAGPGAARHYGIGASSGEIVVIIDDDMTIPSSFLAAHVAAPRPGANCEFHHTVPTRRLDYTPALKKWARLWRMVIPMKSPRSSGSQ